ncbi:hypothetical protein FQA39_LY04103 [Lamprigera yunnana]|nr:hypothetical protein FQA39_LY04103 [Lamprigera yunnana]
MTLRQEYDNFGVHKDTISQPLKSTATTHHLVMVGHGGSPGFKADLRPADLITHENGAAVQGLHHTQVPQLLRSTPSQVCGPHSFITISTNFNFFSSSSFTYKISDSLSFSGKDEGTFGVYFVKLQNLLN